MSEDQGQLISQMQQQIEQQQDIIDKLTQELNFQKQKTSPNQKTTTPQVTQPQDDLNSKSMFFSILSSCLKHFFSKQPQKNSCPQDHYAYQIHFDRRVCNKCSRQRKGGRICSKCSYSLCSKCKAVKHNDLCSNYRPYPYTGYQYCSICQQFSKAGTRCRNCYFIICRQCKPVSHETFCPNVKACQFSYHGSYQICFKCSSYQAGGKRCLTCKINICNSCK